jgi:hypothetical protein
MTEPFSITPKRAGSRGLHVGQAAHLPEHDAPDTYWDADAEATVYAKMRCSRTEAPLKAILFALGHTPSSQHWYTTPAMPTQRVGA